MYMSSDIAITHARPNGCEEPASQSVSSTTESMGKVTHSARIPKRESTQPESRFDANVPAPYAISVALAASGDIPRTVSR